MKALKFGLFLLFAVCIISLVGCGKKAGDTEKPIADVQAEADQMDVEQLKAKATEYKDAIMAKKAEIEKVAAKLKDIPLTEQLGEDAKALQNDIADLNKAISNLSERFQIYYSKLQEKGGDISGLEL
ncbi:MAG: hypothetical protein BWY69_00279 [Planctomycetes bacterium ADurb.Bin401]|nr:MAG: hypothetical protein BWY69_00279 [Planctomycetes bacterium ADurb.Bin401]